MAHLCRHDLSFDSYRLDDLDLGLDDLNLGLKTLDLGNDLTRFVRDLGLHLAQLLRKRIHPCKKCR